MPLDINNPSQVTDRLNDELASDLQRLRVVGQLRGLRVVSCRGPMLTTSDGRELINFTSNSYLGLNEHPAMISAVVDAVQAHGTGAGASLLITGRSPVHEQAERVFSAFKHAEAALLLPSGYMANLAVLTALAGPSDLVCLDKLSHASLIDAARASGAEVRTFPHLMTDKLRRLLSRHAEEHANIQDCGLACDVRPPRRFIVTDSVFSMDGDCADLPALCDLADEYDAVMVVDEAHGTGVLGESGSGLCDAQGVSDRVHVVVSTASKALGGLGGAITSSQSVIDTIVNRARPMIYTTAIPPAQAAAIIQAVKLVEAEPWRRKRLRDLTQRLHVGLAAKGWDVLVPSNHVVPIVPLIVGDADKSISLADYLLSQGIAAPAIRPPTVAPGSARIRLSLRADMRDRHIDHLLEAVSRFGC